MLLGASFTIFHAEGEGDNIGIKIFKPSETNRIKESDFIRLSEKIKANYINSKDWN